MPKITGGVIELQPSSMLQFSGERAVKYSSKRMLNFRPYLKLRSTGSVIYSYVGFT